DGIRYFHVTGVHTCALPIDTCEQIEYMDALHQRGHLPCIFADRFHDDQITIALEVTQAIDNLLARVEQLLDDPCARPRQVLILGAGDATSEQIGRAYV